MNQETVRTRIQKVIEGLGAPVMDYSPTHANVERMRIIEKAVAELFQLLDYMEGI